MLQELLKFEHISKSYGVTKILENISGNVQRGERVGLVGANGSGKSTLLKIILGQLEPDAGSIWQAKGVEIGYLPQTVTQFGQHTIAELIYESRGRLHEIEAEMRRLERAMSDPVQPDFEGVLHQYTTVTEKFEQAGGYDLDYKIKVVLAGLGLEYLPETRPLETLSGGEKTRVGLAALLISSPDLLLLDEPTNHLDGAALEWLEEYLQKYRGGVLAVSHDRQFLNKTIQRILDLNELTHELKNYVGNYDSYYATKLRERRQWEEDYERQQDEIKQLQLRVLEKAHQVAHNRQPRDGDKLIYNGKGENVAKTVSRNVRSAEQALSRLLEEALPKPPKPMVFRPAFDPDTLSSKTAMTVTGVSHWFEAQSPVLQNLNFTLYHDSRIVIVGPNGAGKTTLMNILAGRLQPRQGRVRLAPSLVAGYLTQEEGQLDDHRTVFQAYSEGLNGETQAMMADLINSGLFTYPETTRQLSQLSVGQYRKLQIARLMAQKANLLLLDEPTNHISLEVLEELEQALQEFRGPVIAVSHDRRFIEHFRGEIWELNQGQLKIQ